MEPSETNQENESENKEPEVVSPQPEENAERSLAPIIEPPAPRPESGARRLFRGVLRWLVLVLLLFGAGALATYFLLYQPLTVQHAQTLGDLQQSQQQLDQTQKDLKAAQDQAKSWQGQVQTIQADLAVETNRANLQTVLTDVVTARLALVNKDGASAQSALQAAKTHLGALLPAVKEKDSARADAISARLELVMNELNRDPRTAISDLDVLTRNLQELEKILSPQ